MSISDMQAHTHAAQRVLDTPELLELILRCLPSRDLLLLQRTARLWHGVIASSPHIQRALFMRPDWYLEGKINDPKRAINGPGERPRNNLLLRPVLGGIYPTMTLKLITPATEQNLVRDPYDLSPDIVPQRPSKTEQPSTGHWAWDISVAFPADRRPTTPTSKPAIHFPEASWRKMYLSQPPATSLHLCRRWQRAADPAIERDLGIRMGDFVDLAVKAKESWDERFIGSDRDWHFEGPIQFSHFEEIA